MTKINAPLPVPAAPLPVVNHTRPGSTNNGSEHVTERVSWLTTSIGLEIERAARPASARLRMVLGAVGILGLFVLAHPYRGIEHDAVLYLGRAIAGLDPRGVGGDLTFATDGQFHFSIYPVALTFLTGQLGPDRAGMVATAIGLTAWLCALAALIRAIATGANRWAMLAVAAMAPAVYGGFQVFHVAEGFATPRSLTEAGVLAGLAAYLSNRRGLALSLLVAAAAGHPIMAAPGFGLVIALESIRDPRWIWALAGLAAAGLIAAGLGLPFAQRLMEVYDPDWGEAITFNAYLFPSQWSYATWSRLAVQSGTIALCAVLVRGPCRQLFAAVLGVGVAGLAITSLFGDWVRIVLIVQVQPWRATWLWPIFAAMALPLIGRRLWRQGNAGRSALACLALAWAEPFIVLPAFGLAAAILVPTFRGSDAFGSRTTWFVSACAWTLVAGFECAHLFALWNAAQSAPEGAHLSFLLIWRSQVLFMPFCIGIVAALIGLRHVPTWTIAALAAIVSATSLGTVDDRPAHELALAERRPNPDLTRLLPDDSRSILVLNDPKTAWFLAGRSNWVSRQQGAGVIFSRPLAITWRERMRKLESWHLAHPFTPEDWHRYVLQDALRPSLADLDAACREPGGPSALVLAPSAQLILPPALDYATWTLPAAIMLFTADESLPWITIDRFAVVLCSGSGSAARL